MDSIFVLLPNFDKIDFVSFVVSVVVLPLVIKIVVALNACRCIVIWLYAPMAIMAEARESFTISILPYEDAKVKAKLPSRKYNKNGPVITITPRIVIVIVENLGIKIDMVGTLRFSLASCFRFGTTMNAI